MIRSGIEGMKAKWKLMKNAYESNIRDDGRD